MSRDEWLQQIEANPGDWQMALIAADEIEQAGDELFAEQLRFAVQWTQGGVYSVTVNLLSEIECAPYNVNLRPMWRDYERRWCEQNNVRFIPAFPRSLDDVYEGRELV